MCSVFPVTCHHHSLIPVTQWVCHAPKQLWQRCHQRRYTDIRKSKHSLALLRWFGQSAEWSVSPQQRKTKPSQSFLMSSLEAYRMNNTWCSLYRWWVSVSSDLVGWAQASALHERCDKCLSVPRGKMSPTCVSFTCLETIPVPWQAPGGKCRGTGQHCDCDCWGMIFLSLLSKSRFLFLFLDLVKTSVIGLSLLDVSWK